jgi:hypothetical protein
MMRTVRTALLLLAVALPGACGGGAPTAPSSTSPAPVSSGPSPAQGTDLAAEKLLRAARNTALTYYVNHANTYTGYDAGYANDLQPDLVFNTGPTVEGEVSIREVTPDSILFTTIGASGNPLCIGEFGGRAGETATGLVDATTYAACDGGWPGD